MSWGLEFGGTLGTVYWYSDYDSLAQLEELFGRTMTDEPYQDLIRTANELFAGPPEDTIVYTM